MEKQGTIAALLLMVLAGFCPPALAEPPAGPTFKELGHRVSYFQHAGAGRFAKADFDGDGLSDLAFIGKSTNNVLFVVGQTSDGALGFKQALILDDNPDITRVIHWRNSGLDRVVVVDTRGLVQVFGGWPLQKERQFGVTNDATAAAIADVDADGTDDLLVQTSDSLTAYSLADGQEEWSDGAGGGLDVLPVQLDADLPLELVLAGSQPGLVLDGATRNIDWQYIDGFGALLASGIFSPGAQREWVGANAWYTFTVFRSHPWSPLWDYSTSEDIGAMATGDLDGNGVDSIVYGDGQFGSVHVMDPATQQERFAIQSSHVNSIALANLGGDATPEITFASNLGAPGSVSLTIADGSTGLLKWNFKPTDGPNTVVAIGDVDGDGSEEVVASAGTNSFHDSRVSIFDAKTGVLEWDSDSLDQLNRLGMAVASIKLVHKTGSLGDDILLGGANTYNGTIDVLDGVSKVVKLHLGGYGSTALNRRYISSIDTCDINDDGVYDIVAATYPATSGASGAKLLVYSSADGQLLWQSVTMGTGFYPTNNVLVVPPSSPSAGSEIIAVLPDSLRAYNSQTLLLDWVLPATNEGAVYIKYGVAGPELALFQQNGTLSFYDYASLTFLRSSTLPVPLSGLQAIGSDVHRVLAASGNRLVLVDGASGNVMAQSKYLGPLVLPGNNDMRVASVPANSPSDGDTWLVALPSETALWRFRLAGSDRIFASSFELH